VLPLGGNYVMKAPPYFPDSDVVMKDARSMAEGTAAMKYRPSNGRVVVPVVRLGVLFEGFMPNAANEIDSAWQSRLEETVKAFADEGVYVFLDVHQDGFSTTNGGEGMPWWLTAKMQETSGSVPDCWTCKSSDSYITSPQHPLDIVFPDSIRKALKDLKVSIPDVQIVNNTDPWLAYSVGGGSGDPRRMNVGNVNMRANNNDGAWSQGILGATRQVQSSAWRFYRAHRYPAERAAFFDPFMTFVRYLCDVWDRSSNVIAVELLNEPPFGGLPDLGNAAKVRMDLFDFYSAIMLELEADPNPTKAPLAVEDIIGTSLSPMVQAAAAVVGVEAPYKDAVATLTRWAGRGQLIVSFHWYPKEQTTESSLKKYIEGALFLASRFQNPPIWMSEYFNSPEQTAYFLALASELGCGAVTYWHYTNTDFTKTDGWFRFPAEITAKGRPVDGTGKVNWEAWHLYEKTVAEGTYWGADITGAGGGKMNILKNVPDVNRTTLQVPRHDVVQSRRKHSTDRSFEVHAEPIVVV